MNKNKKSIHIFWKKNKEIKYLFDIFGQTNIKIVGGAVRHALRNKVTNDIDLAVNIEPFEVKKILKKFKIKHKDISKGHGTVIILTNTGRIEITSLRRDIKTYGRKAEVEFTKSFEEDSNRRDFTVNSIYADYEGKLYDPHNGIIDLEKNIIKFIGNPENRIKEDHLRLLRYFRMLGTYCKYESEVEKKSLSACVKNFYKIENLSRERIKLEFFKLILSDNIDFAIFDFSLKS